MSGAIEKLEAAAAATRERQPFDLRLYIAGQTPRSIAAFANLKRLCEEHLAGCYRIEIVDLLDSPHSARDDQIVAVPTLVRNAPPPMRKIIGDLSDTERVLAVMQFVERA
ncbi:MAG TPA: circadian clock KaiB family protein [Xanthomonadales bacterium]|nr:circadian clock KaiB family protein [Xanthomonadales bacterium]